MKYTGAFRIASIVLLVSLISLPALADLSPTSSLGDELHVTTFVDYNGKVVDGWAVPPSPPPAEVRSMSTAEPSASATSKTLDVPAFDWCYGCSATAAAMVMGYYDRIGYDRMYQGPVNGGVCPTTNSTWGGGECPIAATHLGKDNRTIRGYVDDYWIAADNCDTDPYRSGSWTEHTSDCTGDFMGTSQNKWNMCDGWTMFYYNGDNSPTYDVTWCEPGNRDGCHGMRLYAQYKGYTVQTNYGQYIAGYNGKSAGFTFQNYVDEIDAGRPVLIQVKGHTMVGYGYDVTNQTVYIRDTWGHDSDSMTWGGSYSNMQHYAVTVFRLAPVTIETPTFSPDFGTYYAPQNVAVSCATAGATIHYTIGGADPTESDPVISSGSTILIDKATTLRAKAFKSGMNPSATKAALYGLKVPIPTFNPSAGAYEIGQTVAINCAAADVTVRYTTNGAEPGINDTVYTTPIVLDHSMTIKAKGWKTNWLLGSSGTASYTTYQSMSIPAVKDQADNIGVKCAGAVVSTVMGNTFYVESEDRVCGIKVNMTGHKLTPGIKVDVVGTMKTLGGERYIDASSVTTVGTGSVAPIGISPNALGGGAWHYNSSNGGGQRGINGSYGPNNVGLLIKTWGQVAGMEPVTPPAQPTWFTIDDGSGAAVKVIVPAGVGVDPNWQYVTVTGASACELSGTVVKRVVRAGSQGDIASAKGASISGRIATISGSKIYNTVIETPHPYAANSNLLWTFYGPVGVNKIRTHLVEADMQMNHDFLRLRDASDYNRQIITNNAPVYDFWSNWVPGNLMKLKFDSDASDNRWGFKVDQFECDLASVPVSGATITLNPGGRTTVSRGDGSYNFDGLAAGSYALSASLPNVTATPASLPITVAANQRVSNADFAADSAKGSLGGKITQDATLTGKSSTECEHPYPNSANLFWTISAPAGAVRLRAHFPEIEMEPTDYFHVKDINGAIQQSFNNSTAIFDVWSNWVAGSALQLNLYTDAAGQHYGFSVDKYEYEMITPMGGVTVTVNPGGLSTVTSADGTFLFYGLNDGMYTVTPSLTGAAFTPASKSVTVSGIQHQSGVDFVK